MIRAALAALMLAQPALAQPAGLRQPTLMTYYESWLDPPDEAAVATLPRSLDIVALAFARPDLRYAGGLQLAGTGLQFTRDGASVRAAIVALRRANPAVRVLLALGGAAYGHWAELDTDAVARLVRDLGVDGVDVDFEPGDPGCHSVDGAIACASDAQWQAIVTRVRASLPRPFLLTVPGWSVGAYGEGAWAEAPPRSPWTGSMLRLLQSPAAAAIDLVSVMAYDAGPRFDPAQAVAAYRAVWHGPLLLGASIAEGSAWLAPARASDAMLYGWLSRPPPGQPDAGAIAATLCRAQPACARR